MAVIVIFVVPGLACKLFRLRCTGTPLYNCDALRDWQGKPGYVQDFTVGNPHTCPPEGLCGVNRALDASGAVVDLHGGCFSPQHWSLCTSAPDKPVVCPIETMPSGGTRRLRCAVDAASGKSYCEAALCDTSLVTPCFEGEGRCDCLTNDTEAALAHKADAAILASWKQNMKGKYFQKVGVCAQPQRRDCVAIDSIGETVGAASPVTLCGSYNAGYSTHWPQCDNGVSSTGCCETPFTCANNQWMCPPYQSWTRTDECVPNEPVPPEDVAVNCCRPGTSLPGHDFCCPGVPLVVTRSPGPGGSGGEVLFDGCANITAYGVNPSFLGSPAEMPTPETGCKLTPAMKDYVRTVSLPGSITELPADALSALPDNYVTLVRSGSLPGRAGSDGGEVCLLSAGLRIRDGRPSTYHVVDDGVNKVSWAKLKARCELQAVTAKPFEVAPFIRDQQSEPGLFACAQNIAGYVEGSDDRWVTNLEGVSGNFQNTLYYSMTPGSDAADGPDLVDYCKTSEACFDVEFNTRQSSHPDVTPGPALDDPPLLSPLRDCVSTTAADGTSTTECSNQVATQVQLGASKTPATTVRGSEKAHATCEATIDCAIRTPYYPAGATTPWAWGDRFKTLDPNLRHCSNLPDAIPGTAQVPQDAGDGCIMRALPDGKSCADYAETYTPVGGSNPTKCTGGSCELIPYCNAAGAAGDVPERLLVSPCTRYSKHENSCVERLVGNLPTVLQTGKVCRSGKSKDGRVCEPGPKYAKKL